MIAVIEFDAATWAGRRTLSTLRPPRAPYWVSIMKNSPANPCWNR